MKRKLALFALGCAVVAAVPLFAASYVVPPDDVFIGKSDIIVIARAVQAFDDRVLERPEAIVFESNWVLDYVSHVPALNLADDFYV